MSNPFQGVRERGGLNGVRSLSFESMGISWQDVIDKRQAYFESLEAEMDSMLERLCHQRNVRRNTLGLSRRASVVFAPTMKTPAPSAKGKRRAVRKRPLLEDIEEKEVNEVEPVPLKPIDDNVQTSVKATTVRTRGQKRKKVNENMAAAEENKVVKEEKKHIDTHSDDMVPKRKNNDDSTVLEEKTVKVRRSERLSKKHAGDDNTKQRNNEADLNSQRTARAPSLGSDRQNNETSTAPAIKSISSSSASNALTLSDVSMNNKLIESCSDGYVADNEGQKQERNHSTTSSKPRKEKKLKKGPKDKDQSTTDLTTCNSSPIREVATDLNGCSDLNSLNQSKSVAEEHKQASDEETPDCGPVLLSDSCAKETKPQGLRKRKSRSSGKTTRVSSKKNSLEDSSMLSNQNTTQSLDHTWEQSTSAEEVESVKETTRVLRKQKPHTSKEKTRVIRKKMDAIQNKSSDLLVSETSQTLQSEGDLQKQLVVDAERTETTNKGLFDQAKETTRVMRKPKRRSSTEKTRIIKKKAESSSTHGQESTQSLGLLEDNEPLDNSGHNATFVKEISSSCNQSSAVEEPMETEIPQTSDQPIVSLVHENDSVQGNPTISSTVPTTVDPVPSSPASDVATSFHSVESNYETCPSNNATPLISSIPKPISTAVPYLKKSPLSLIRIRERLNSTYSLAISPLENKAYTRPPSITRKHKLDDPDSSSPKRPAVQSQSDSDTISPINHTPQSSFNAMDSSLAMDTQTATESDDGSLSKLQHAEEEEEEEEEECNSSSSVTCKTEEKDKVKNLQDKWRELMDAAKSRKLCLPLNTEGVKASFIPTRNSPAKAAENKQMRKEKLAAKIAEKIQREAARKKELETRKEQERLEKIKKREERMKRIADNQAALQKRELEKRQKIKEGKQAAKEKQKEKEEKNSKLKERQEAAEQRRLEQERLKKQKLKEIEEERKLVEGLHQKRLKLEEEERLRKKQEKAEIEKERQKRKEELVRKKQEEKKMNKVMKPAGKPIGKKIPAVIDEESRERIKQDWRAIDETFEKVTEEIERKKASSKEALAEMGSYCPQEVPRNTTVAESSIAPPTNQSDGEKSKKGLSDLMSQWKKQLEKEIGSSTPQTSSITSNSALPSKYQDISTYEITPITQNPLAVADDYGLSDLESDQSTDDEDAPKKAVPLWAASENISKAMRIQNDDTAQSIFPPEELLKSPDLAKIFPKLRKRFFKRTSSAQWTSPMLKSKYTNHK